MGYRNLEKPVLRHIDGLTSDCGLFTSATELNNGYGCMSKSKQKTSPGCCYDFDCPLAWTADLEDMKEYGEDDSVYLEWKEHFKETGHGPEESGADYVVQFREVV